MCAYSNPSNIGAFVPTTNIWDVSQLYDIDVTSTEFKELLVRLYQNVNNIALSLNLKDTGYYDITEFLNSQLFFPNPALSSLTPQKPIYRQVFRKVINFGALPNTASKSVAHGIAPTAAFSFTRIYASATDPLGLVYLPIPYASAIAANTIELFVDATNVTIITGSNRSAFTICYVIVEYIKE